jgi:threonine aldolase
MSRSSRLVASSAIRNLSCYPRRPLSVSGIHSTVKINPIVPLPRTFASSSVDMGDAISEKPHNAWLGAKGPAALDLRSTSQIHIMKH